MRKVLDNTKGNVSKTARILTISRKTVRRARDGSQSGRGKDGTIVTAKEAEVWYCMHDASRVQEGVLNKKKIILVPLFAAVILCCGCATRRPAGREVQLPACSEGTARTVGKREGAAGGSEAVEIQYTVAPWHGFSRAACSLTFDDGTKDQFALAYPELEKRGLTATFFLITRFRKRGYWKDGDTRRSLFGWDEARELYGAGHEIGSHTISHPDLTKEKTRARWEIAGALSKLKKEIPSLEETTFAWPYWRSDEKCRESAADYYVAARAGSGTVENYKKEAAHRRIDLFRVDSLPMRGGQFHEPWKSGFETVLDNTGWLVLCFHGIDDGRIDTAWLGWDPMTLKQFQETLDWIQGRSFWVAPFGTVARYIRERDRAALTLLYAEDGRYVLSLEDDLDDRIFCLPLTLKLALPVSWRTLRISQHRRELLYEVSPDGALLFDALPDGTPVYIERL
ncbi:MAG: polysaccharide deacetylase family protein [Spirochaetes bacterium]|nr:polysaccharide deacetylase family protein [Spirochaetota bacterium]